MEKLRFVVWRVVSMTKPPTYFSTAWEPFENYWVYSFEAYVLWIVNMPFSPLGNSTTITVDGG
jgi:hypothetical protein